MATRYDVRDAAGLNVCSWTGDLEPGDTVQCLVEPDGRHAKIVWTSGVVVKLLARNDIGSRDPLELRTHVTTGA